MNFKRLSTALAISLFLFYTLWWLWMFFFLSPETPLRDYFSDTYGILAGLGGLIGIAISRKWDGMKSYVGRSLIFFSLGLLSQFLGQLSYTIQYYIYNMDIYPSFGEIFFLVSIPFYILAVWYIAKASGSSISLRSLKNRVGAVVLPILLVGISYFLFINGTNFGEQSLVENILSFSYPMGQAIFVSFAALAYYLTLGVSGGLMKKRVSFILFALLFQYIADSAFQYETIKGIYAPADVSEYMFVISYFLMTVALIQFLSVFEQLRKD
jgi:hypothetical protein